MLKLNAIARLGKDATTNNINGKTVINFSAAHSEVWKDQNGERKERTTWLSCSQWTEKTGIVPYLKKGTLVYVEGIPSIRAYESNGQHQVSLELRVGQVQLLSKPEETPVQQRQPEPQDYKTDAGIQKDVPPPPFNDDGDQLPF